MIEDTTGQAGSLGSSSNTDKSRRRNYRGEEVPKDWEDWEQGFYRMMEKMGIIPWRLYQ